MVADPKSDQPDEPDEPDEPVIGDRAQDSLRSAVERTLAATAGSASETRQRARDLLDELARQGEEAREELARRGEAAREGINRRAGAAREDLTRRGGEAGQRLADAVAELRPADRADLGGLRERVGVLERRLGDLEHQIMRGERGSPSVPNPEVEGETSTREADSGA